MDYKEKQLFTDNVYHLKWDEGRVLKCPNPAVIAYYGQGGECTVSIYSCFKCRYGRRYKWIGAVSCDYGKDAGPE